MRDRASRLLALGAAIALVVGLAAPLPAAAQPDSGGRVDVIEVSGLIDAIEVDFVRSSLEEAAQARAEALVVQLDSSGAVADRSDLDGLASEVSHSSVPVAVWVGPTGAVAEGGARSLVRAAAVVGIAPDARLARIPGVVPQVAPTLGDFIVGLDGREVAGRTLHTARVVQTSAGPRRQPVGARFAKLGLVARLLHTVSSPSVAYLLLVVGLLLVVFEFFTAGIGVAGVTGAGALVLAAYGLAVLPTRGWALALVAVGIVGYAVDVQAGAPRAWTVIGTVSLLAGSLGLIARHPVPLIPVVLVVAGTALFMVAGMPAMLRTRFSTPTIGRESMVGELGAATSPVDPEGTVELRGALWRARTNRATPITAGDRVRVVAIDGLLLEVEPEEGGAREMPH